MYDCIRFSRLTHPRASRAAFVLLAGVFSLFGAVASALHPELGAAATAATPKVLAGAAELLGNWISC